VVVLKALMISSKCEHWNVTTRSPLLGLLAEGDVLGAKLERPPSWHRENLQVLSTFESGGRLRCSGKNVGMGAFSDKKWPITGCYQSKA
jgi:hypothetical protein